MNERLKYQDLIDELKLNINCPSEAFPIEKELNVFRFTFSPIEHLLNFLPNVLFDRNRKIPYSPKDKKQICLRCGASFFLKKEVAVNKWRHLSKTVRENIGYTHIAQGILNKNSGLIIEPKNYHLTLFEFEKGELRNHFLIAEELK